MDDPFPPVDETSAPPAPRAREPAFNAPAVVVATIAVLVAVHVARLEMPTRWDDWIVANFSFIPARTTLALDPARWSELAARAAGDPQRLRAAQFLRDIMGGGGAKLWTLVTYAFLHGGFAHLGLNSIWLLAFGAPVARRTGTLRFLALAALTAGAGAAVEWAARPLGIYTLIGASASVSGLMGAAMRFMFARPDSDPFDGPSGGHRATAPLSALLRDRRALLFAGAWLLINYVVGAYAPGLGLGDAPVAWRAHVGGFVVGMLTFPLFDRAGAPPPP